MLVWMQNVNPKANMQTAAFSWRFIYHDLSSAGHEADVEIDRLILCENGPLFLLALEPAEAIVILNFSSISNALQTCKWYLGNLLRSLKFDLGFKMQVSTAMPLQTSLEVPPGD